MDKKYSSNNFKIDLQLFADPDKTEDPTPRKLQKAREEGNVPQSKEFNQAVGFLAVSLFLILLIGPIFNDLIRIFYDFFDLNTNIIDENLIPFTFFQHSELYIKISLLFVGGAVVSLLLAMIQTKFLVAPKAIKFDPNKLNPIKGMKKIFSMKSIVELIKAISKIIIVSFLAYNIIINNLDEIISLAGEEIYSSIYFIGLLMIEIIFKLGIALLVLSFADLLFQKYDYKKNLRMTKKEVKDERKDIDGNPEVKRKQRQIMQKILFSRMMQQVPSADVVVTNPTHYAVAIKYDSQNMKAPKVIAKGVDEIAEKIKKIARENYIPIVEKPSLARQLYNNIDLNETIGEEFFKPIAEILAEIYKTKSKV